MELKLKNNQSIRVTGDDGLDAHIVDVRRKDINEDEYDNSCISVTMHDLNQIFVVSKERALVTFVFKKSDKVYKSDLGFYSDGEILFTNSKLLKDENIDT